jgi:hypothetical protein
VDVVEPFDQAFPDGPPADPEEWTDEQWLAWLQATDANAPVEGGGRPATTGGRITHSSGGQVLGAAMFGMANAIYGRHDDEVVIVAEGDSAPDGDEPFTVHLDLDHPERSSVVFRAVPEPPP